MHGVAELSCCYVIDWSDICTNVGVRWSGVPDKVASEFVCGETSIHKNMYAGELNTHWKTLYLSLSLSYKQCVFVTDTVFWVKSSLMLSYQLNWTNRHERSHSTGTFSEAQSTNAHFFLSLRKHQVLTYSDSYSTQMQTHANTCQKGSETHTQTHSVRLCKVAKNTKASKVKKEMHTKERGKNKRALG